MVERFGTALDVAGLAAIGYGLWLIWPPLALIWVGLALLAVSARASKASQ